MIAAARRARIPRIRGALSSPWVLWFLLLGLSLTGRASGDDQGRQLYLDYCSSCHGENLEGQANWMVRLQNGRLPAPPHDASGHTWHHSDRQLTIIVKEGLQAFAPGYHTDMPAFAGVLTDRQIKVVLEYIKSTWPERERTYQRERTKRDQ